MRVEVPGAAEAAIKEVEAWAVETGERATAALAAEAFAFARNAVGAFRTRRGCRALTNVVQAVAWQWCVKARLTTRRSRTGVPGPRRSVRRRTRECIKAPETPISD